MPEKTSHVFGLLLRLARGRAVRAATVGTSLLLLGVYAAFGIAPATVTEDVVISPVIEDLALKPVIASGSADQTYWREERIQRGDTFASLLARLQIEDAHAVRFLRLSDEARGLRHLVPGQVVRVHTGEDGRLLELRYTAGLMVLTVKPRGDGFRVGEEVATMERRIVMRSAQIKSSLFAAIDAARLDDSIAGQLADIFSAEIDFHRDLRVGDRFSVVYEMYFSGGEAVRSGRVLAAEFINGETVHQALWFRHADGQGDYYSPDGKSIRKAFTRSPLEFSRISSGFTHARFHPILERWQAHRGIDYAAAVGTGVKATSDGIVESRGFDRGYGNFVVLRHQQKWTTLYGHLSGFGSGINTGARVSQGQVIGYVGSTGLATGPHLHYEFRINGVHQDPLTVMIPDAPPITPDLKAKFDIAARPLVQNLTLLRQTRVAHLN